MLVAFRKTDKVSNSTETIYVKMRHWFLSDLYNSSHILIICEEYDEDFVQINLNFVAIVAKSTINVCKLNYIIKKSFSCSRL